MLQFARDVVRSYWSRVTNNYIICYNRYIIAISTHIKEVGEELFQVKNHKDSLTDVAVFNGQAASCGDGQ